MQTGCMHELDKEQDGTYINGSVGEDVRVLRTESNIVNCENNKCI